MDSAANRYVLRDGWKVAPEDRNIDTRRVSTVGYDDRAWTPAVVPGTVLGALVGAGRYPDLFVGEKLARVPRDQFDRPWWYRTEFTLDRARASSRASLQLDGINYRAEVFLNGRPVPSGEDLVGAFRRFRLDVTSLVKAGPNALAVRVRRPHSGDFSTGFVDWNPAPPDGNMGIFRPISLHTHGPIAIESPFVATRLEAGGERAALTVQARLVNEGSRAVDGDLQVDFLGRTLRVPFSVEAGSHADLSLLPKRHTELRIDQPSLWWPHTMGEPVLHTLRLAAVVDGEVSDRAQRDFGIRQVEDYFTGDGHRGFLINGKELLITGAGWTDDLLLADSPEKLEAQVRYVRHMGLNTIRLEGIWGSDQTLYDLCDRYGVLMMVGWSCHWEHEQYLGREADGKYGGILSDSDVALVARSWEDQVMWLRHHPSIFVWAVGSDKMPAPELEWRYIDTFRRCDRTRPYLISTAGYGSEEGVITHKRIESEISGASGMKMLGPYDYTPPVYWYADTKRGGAYGFNTETGPGAQPPVLETIERMIPEDDRWPIGPVWDFHCARNEFDRLDRFLEAMGHRLGAPENLHDFDRKAQVLNYELMRPMFEAFRVNRGRATGVIQWMLNAAWPKLYWQLFDYYLAPNAAFYATRKALRPVHLAYDYAASRVWLVHDNDRSPDELSARLRLIDVRGRDCWRFERDLASERGMRVAVADVPAPPAEGGLLDLRLRTNRGDEIDQSVYWLSAEPDVLDYGARVEPWPFYTPSSRFATQTYLNELEPAELEAAWCIQPRGERYQLTATMRNRSAAPAFFVEVRLVDRATGRRHLPIFWEDNYITLLPGELRSLIAFVDRKPAGAAVEIAGWNVKPFRPEP